MELVKRDKKNITTRMALLLGFIPMVNNINIVVVSAILAIILIKTNIINNGVKKRFNIGEVFIYNLKCMILYYLVAFTITLFTYSEVLNIFQIRNNNGLLDYAFMLLDPKIILISISITLSSYICSLKHSKSGILSIILAIINTALLIYIIKF
ncbi:hypothetical protein [Clostridium septicum]|uniref:Uncharacterized protein n=1 Tax=Clostridium septicum TaxID=1504 RepID=A0A9N7JK16_CLOSE|nr:hypothetical protein [Clostridium septicum]AYE33775.1 hypothetical protein CP523_04440 [Clostridium septicum]MDU1313704.1 hypothetical protein [Clostridium septicum]QAS61933.1 hypothetical protein EI377_14985 [Clostridium septicum]UEC21615.1 hypothetical protein LK444_04390 [Clostridium septicum]USS00335.1 hypothetical protein NH397_12685 [Clostridium septicum]